MHEDVEGEKSPTEIIEEMRKRIQFMRDHSQWMKIRNVARYEEFLLTLESADFYLEKFEMDQADTEIERARILVNQK